MKHSPTYNSLSLSVYLVPTEPVKFVRRGLVYCRGPLLFKFKDDDKWLPYWVSAMPALCCTIFLLEHGCLPDPPIVLGTLNECFMDGPAHYLIFV